MPLNAESSSARHDIQGLRAIAVLAVVMNHASPTALRGGFVGVDIFFVISGYLIGTRLLQDLGAARFSFVEFYKRRARRLLPALIAMLVAVWALGWFYMSGPEFLALGKQMMAAAAFSNNALLWSQVGYFDVPPATVPLLHLWSLGIEEQFYLLIPVLLWWGVSGRGVSIRWVLRLSAVSLLLTAAYPEAHFYLLDTRFWELGAGVGIGYLSRGPLRADTFAAGVARYRELVAFVALLMFVAVLIYASKDHPWDPSSAWASAGLALLAGCGVCAVLLADPCRNADVRRRVHAICCRYQRRARAVAGGVGLLLILVSLAAMPSFNWPGPQTVFPVLGCTLVIASGRKSPFNRLLAWRPLVLIGGISYPLYLWHWPLLVFWGMWHPGAGGFAALIPVIAAVLLACLTSMLIEDPIRFGRFGTIAVGIPRIRSLAAGFAIIGLVGVATVATGGFAARFSPSLRAVANWSLPHGDAEWRTHQCFFDRVEPTAFATECTPRKRPGVQQLLLWGDSHAADLYPGLAKLQRAQGFSIVQWTSAGCPPVRSALPGEGPGCAARRAQALKDLGGIKADIVLLSASWEMYQTLGSSEADILAAIDEDVRWLQRSGVERIVLFGPGHSWIRSEPAELLAYMLDKRLEQIPERIGSVPAAIRHFDLAMSAQAAAEHVRYVSVLDRMCDSTGCLVAGDRTLSPPDLLFRDTDHLTPSGSSLLVDGASRQLFGAP